MYAVLLFLHITGALGLFVSIGLEQAGLYRLRRATNGAQVAEWASVLSGLRRIDGPSGLLLLATGVYLLMTRWGYQGWAGLALLGLVVMGALGGAVTGRRIRAIAWEATGMVGPIPAELAQLVADPLLRGAATMRAAIGVGIVFNMVTKPSVSVAAAVLGVAIVVGALVLQLGAQRRSSSTFRSPTGVPADGR